MQRIQYKNIILNIYNSWGEYEKEEGVETIYEDEYGNELDIKTSDIDFSGSQSRPHFTDEDSFEHSSLYWEAMIDSEPKSINCIVLDNVEEIKFKDLLAVVGHEYGHIIDASKFINATAPLGTDENYVQEETKAIEFETFVKDVYEMTDMFVQMFELIGVPCLYR